jgi:hypothetical protein
MLNIAPYALHRFTILFLLTIILASMAYISAEADEDV